MLSINLFEPKEEIPSGLHSCALVCAHLLQDFRQFSPIQSLFLWQLSRAAHILHWLARSLQSWKLGNSHCHFQFHYYYFKNTISQLVSCGCAWSTRSWACPFHVVRIRIALPSSRPILATFIFIVASLCPLPFATRDWLRCCSRSRSATWRKYAPTINTLASIAWLFASGVSSTFSAFNRDISLQDKLRNAGVRCFFVWIPEKSNQD